MNQAILVVWMLFSMSTLGKKMSPDDDFNREIDTTFPPFCRTSAHKDCSFQKCLHFNGVTRCFRICRDVEGKECVLG